MGATSGIVERVLQEAMPGIKAKLAAKLTELEREFDRARAAMQRVRHDLLHADASALMQLSAPGPGMARGIQTGFGQSARPSAPASLQRNLKELEGWARSIVESMAYVESFSGSDARGFRDAALAAMRLGEDRAKDDLRAVGASFEFPGVGFFRQA